MPFLVTILQINVKEEYILNIFRGFKLARIGKMARHNNSLRLVLILISRSDWSSRGQIRTHQVKTIKIGWIDFTKLWSTAIIYGFYIGNEFNFHAILLTCLLIGWSILTNQHLLWNSKSNFCIFGSNIIILCWDGDKPSFWFNTWRHVVELHYDFDHWLRWCCPNDTYGEM